MEDQVDELRLLGESIASVEDQVMMHLDCSSHARQRFVVGGSERIRKGHARGYALIAIIVVSLFSFAAFRYGTVSRPLTFELGPAAGSAKHGTGRGIVGAWIAAPAQEPFPIRFSEGTEFVLDRMSQMRVVETGPRGARLVLEGGMVHAQVVHKRDAAWTVNAGPFEVHVTGTRFDLGWDATQEILTLDLQEGGVMVSGCSLGNGQRIVAGQALRVSCKEERGNAPSEAPVPTNFPSFVDASDVPRSAPAAPNPPATALSTSESSGEAQSSGFDAGFEGESWKELVARAEYASAFAAAEREGFEQEVERADASDVELFADAARLAGHPKPAHKALIALRHRFKGEEVASVAAFKLGLIAFDEEAAYAPAARWFATYLQESPGGPLVREAAGRAIEAYKRAGDRSAARAVAQDYLARYPTGPHASLAREVLRP